MGGAGAGQAFEDAAVLSSIFAGIHKATDIPWALAAYDNTRRARAQSVVRQSKANQNLLSFQIPGTTNDNIVSRLVRNGGLDWIANRDAEEQNRYAVHVFQESLPPT
jgi:2-polyprenyl-6-methoxyphenol hydroxylase-like FAD-dependent oxidoreductase